MLECSCCVLLQVSTGHLKSRTGKGSVQITRSAGYVRHLAEVDAGCLRRFHIQPGLLVEKGATDPMPVIPPAKVSLIQAACRNTVPYYKFGCIQTFESGGP